MLVVFLVKLIYDAPYIRRIWTLLKMFNLNWRIFIIGNINFNKKIKFNSYNKALIVSYLPI
ncbi:conserved hypothetical protein (plasmid) [Borreliella bissettiae DN127]|uniref:Uncharacterized protein n=2 Tax=Borrelia bissettiae TaxID=64897 RepID=A0A1L8Z9U5_BORBI|nr:conserved hypothetical protein [Borreliella bissettiae DN127]OJH14527.1 hypothetical protein ER70_08250 [Borreliella bissettiae]